MAEGETKHDPPLYHGGAPGLTKRILSRGVLPGWKGSTVQYAGLNSVRFGDMGNRVHVTADLEVARAYAAQYLDHRGQRRPGSVYEVTPIGNLEPDPDYLVFPHTFKRAPAARIVRVVEEDLYWPNPRRMAKAVGKYQIWKDGTDVYDQDGYFLLQPSVLKAGGTAEKVRKLGPWMPVPMVTLALELRDSLAELPPPLE